MIDSPVYPDELAALPVLLAQVGFGFSGLLATHGDRDHLLGRLAFPGAWLGVAETTAARLRAEPAAAQRELRDFDDRHHVSSAGAGLARLGRGAVRGSCRVMGSRWMAQGGRGAGVRRAGRVACEG